MERVQNQLIFTYKYKCNSGDYFVEICEDNLWCPFEYEAWLYRDGFGIKLFMFGVETKKVSMDEFIDLVEKNIQMYIRIYEIDVEKR